MSKMNADPENKIREVAERIRAVRESVGFTPEEMAEKIDVSVEKYLSYESGERDFSFTFIYKVANLCNVEMTDLMEGQSPSLESYTVTRKGEGTPIARKKDLFTAVLPLCSRRKWQNRSL